MSFFNYALKQMMTKDNLLVKVDNIINWEDVKLILDKSLGKRKSLIPGQVPYEYLNLFKILLLQQWHNLSDPKAEESLKTRIDFMWFCGFGLATNDFIVPDETTICRFRNKLVKHKILEQLLRLVNTSLENNNLKVKISDGAILDATLIEACVNSKAKKIVIVEDRKEDKDDSDGNNDLNLVEDKDVKGFNPNDQSEIEIDKDAKWLKKGKRNVFGFKNFVVTDSTDGYIEAIDTTPANISEITDLGKVLSKVANNEEIKVLYTDKGH